MRTIMVSRRVLGWLGLLAMVAGCTATSASSAAAPGHGRSASPAAAAAVSSGAASGSASAGPGGARDLAVSRAVRNELAAAYADFRGISLSDVEGTEPGSVYYAYDPATDTYWARATFVPSRTASFKVLVGFQDGADIGLFTRAARSGWQVERGGEPVVCAEVVFFPVAVLRAWSLSTDTAASFGCISEPGSPGEFEDPRRRHLDSRRLAADALPGGVRLRRRLRLGGIDCRNRALRAAQRVHRRSHQQRLAPVRPAPPDHLSQYRRSAGLPDLSVQ